MSNFPPLRMVPAPPEGASDHSAALAYLHGLIQAASIAKKHALESGLWWYDTGAHAGRTEGWVTGYRAGRTAGIQEGREQLAAELDAERLAWLETHNRSLADLLTTTPTFAELSDRRGDHERAQRHRQIRNQRRIEAHT